MDAKVARERLEREKADLAGTVRRIRERLAIPERDSGGDSALVDQHPADAASETDARELDVARQAMFEARLGLHRRSSRPTRARRVRPLRGLRQADTARAPRARPRGSLLRRGRGAGAGPGTMTGCGPPIP